MFKVLDNLLFKMNFKFFLRRLKILIHILSKVNPHAFHIVIQSDFSDKPLCFQGLQGYSLIHTH